MTKKLQTIGDIMTPNPISVDPAATLRDALMLMQRFQIRHLPVTLGKQLTGIVSDRDIRLHLSERDGTIFETLLDGEKLDGVIVEDLMTRQPLSVTPATPLLDAIDIMLDEKIGAVPVVADNKSGELVGIVSYLDLLAYLRDLVVELV